VIFLRKANERYQSVRVSTGTANSTARCCHAPCGKQITGQAREANAERLETLTRPNGTRRTQTYDLAGRLATVQDVRVSDGTSIVSLEMRYDAAGRLWAKRQLPAWPTVAPPTPRSAIADADNRLESVGSTAVVHDDDGNMLSAFTASPSWMKIGRRFDLKLGKYGYIFVLQ
jgi:YD repeat-containing protein